MKNTVLKTLVLVFGLFATALLSSCGVECQECLANGNPDVVDHGLACPEDYANDDAFQTFITQYEQTGGTCD